MLKQILSVVDFVGQLVRLRASFQPAPSRKLCDSFRLFASRSTFIVLCLLLQTLLHGQASGAGGTWKATYKTSDGYKHESTLDLQVTGDKVAGKITSKRGTVAIDEGSVNGRLVSFTVIRKGNGDELRVEFTGRVEGNTMKLKMQYRDHAPVELIAQRIS